MSEVLAKQSAPSAWGVTLSDEESLSENIGGVVVERVSQASMPIFGVLGASAANTVLSAGIGVMADAGLVGLTAATVSAAPVIIPAVALVSAVAGGRLVKKGMSKVLTSIGMKVKAKPVPSQKPFKIEK